MLLLPSSLALDTDSLVWPSGLAAVLAGATVLVVDDEPANVLLLRHLLERRGVGRIDTLTDSRETLAACRATNPDLVLLDLHMPHLDGHAVLRQLRSSLPPTTFLPVLVLTADVTSEARDQALSEGANDFVTKPFAQAEVLARVSNLLWSRALHQQLQVHNADLSAALTARLEADRREAHELAVIGERTRRALDGGALRMVFQPVLDLQRGSVVGVEALARFPVEPYRPPNEWFDDARRAGLGDELELAAVRAALRQLDVLPPEVFLAVNLSPECVASRNLAKVFDAVDGRRVVLELTEHTRVQDYALLLPRLDELRLQGVRIAVDDTGAGYAGLQHILELVPDILKLDLQLIRGIDADPIRRALTSALVNFAAELGAGVIAEGIETPAELATLQSLGVDWGQGYLFARPGDLPTVIESATLTGDYR
jgi:EAL domain-containing protein (putative c-di-GMP-specific phosphodiesterase class I)/AmiR/NasT family two-component response regulator